VKRASSAAVTVEVLADRPDLLIPLARLRSNEWSDHPGREELRWWIETTRREAGRDAVPITFVATDSAADVVGGVGIIPVDLPERDDRGPWVVGTVVRADCRGQGVGTTRLTRWAIGAGVGQLWVATSGRAIDFYRRCGFVVTEVVRLPGGDQPTILTAELPRHPLVGGAA
jgi:GNAT superfamily N-acetyltransferase